jgi:hypothetical protein
MQKSLCKNASPSSTHLSHVSKSPSLAQLYLPASALASAFLANRASLLASFLVSLCVCALCASSCLPSFPLACFGWLRVCFLYQSSSLLLVRVQLEEEVVPRQPWQRQCGDRYSLQTEKHQAYDLPLESESKWLRRRVSSPGWKSRALRVGLMSRGFVLGWRSCRILVCRSSCP